jgi:acyl-CoA synthetase (AMP-forming)/AMP-acid ligase II
LFTERYTPLEVLSQFRTHEPTLWGMLESRAQVGPTRSLLLFEGHVCTYGEAAARAEAIARSLYARGIAKGQRVAVMATNSEAHVLLLLALANVGAIAVPVNPEWNATEAGYIFRHAEVAAVACTSASLPTARAACGELANRPWFLLPSGGLSPDLRRAVPDATSRRGPARPYGANVGESRCDGRPDLCRSR